MRFLTGIGNDGALARGGFGAVMMPAIFKPDWFSLRVRPSCVLGREFIREDKVMATKKKKKKKG